jgi:hypothetical protein
MSKSNQLMLFEGLALRAMLINQENTDSPEET